MRYDTLGVLGGMGPAATVDFLSCLVDVTPADRDQDHVPVIVYGDPTVPDRTAAIRDGGESPLPALLRGVRFLSEAGVAAIAIPCNTAHHWFDELREAATVPLLHIVDAVLDRVVGSFKTGAVVGVLSTDGTRRSGLYRARLEPAGLTVLEPTDVEIKSYVDPGIAAVKAGNLEQGAGLLRRVGELLAERGASAVVVACTDMSVVLDENQRMVDAAIIDANYSLAVACEGRLSVMWRESH